MQGLRSQLENHDRKLNQIGFALVDSAAIQKETRNDVKTLLKKKKGSI
jgi:hypothetical protein